MGVCECPGKKAPEDLSLEGMKEEAPQKQNANPNSG